MNRLSALACSLWQRIRGPKLKPGDRVANSLSGGREVLRTYRGPYIGGAEGGGYVCDELWVTGNDNEVAVGTNWKVIP